jgi:hypothetical protein
MKIRPENTKKKNIFQRLRTPGKRLFWLWVAYQAVKGTLTTSLIWAPLIYMWLHSAHTAPIP